MSERTINFTNGIWRRSNRHHPLSLSLSRSLARSLLPSLGHNNVGDDQPHEINRPRLVRFHGSIRTIPPPLRYKIGPSRDREKNFRARKSRERFVFEFISRVSLSNLDANLRSDGNFPALAKERRWMEEEETENEEERRSEAKRIDELRQYDLSRHPRSRQRFT